MHSSSHRMLRAMWALMRRVWTKRMTLLPFILFLYISISILTSSKSLKALLGKKRFKYGSVKITSYVDLSQADIPRYVMSPMDLTLPGNQVLFNPIKSSQKCFQFYEGTPDELDDMMKNKSKPAERIKSALKSFYGSIASGVGNSLSVGGEETTKEMSKEETLELYRDSLDFAKEKIEQTAMTDHVNQCIFHGFSMNESEAMWWQAERHVRAHQSCRRYHTIPDVRDLRAYNLRQHRGSGVRLCAPAKIGPIDWQALVLDSSQSSKSKLDDFHRTRNRGPGDDVARELQEQDGLTPLENDVQNESRWERPLTIIVSTHPILRLVMAYLFGIKAGYRKDDQIKWIKEIRGKSIQTLLDEIKSSLAKKNPDVANSKLLTKLFYVEHLDESTDSLNTTEADELSFREFVWVVIRDVHNCVNDFQCLTEIDELWRPQYVQCSPCSIAFDVLSEIDTLYGDSAILSKLIGQNAVFGNIFKENVPETDSDPFITVPPLKTNSTNLDETDDENKENFESGSKVCEKIKDQSQGTKNFERNLSKLKSVAIDYINTISAQEYKILYGVLAFDFTLFGYAGMDLFKKCSTFQKEKELLD
ncbi:uncharacterized protein LOC108681059 [Hyalella azteca]|uniref:Carbohydrate sulfotransferase n=1 Tax=Hyalella azteca TaxID=294128 RepID=A0A8B7PHP6_HYAAZ|nr:uncharacterized protein LOC108681059 [Hyalella azteca]